MRIFNKTEKKQLIDQARALHTDDDKYPRMYRVRDLLVGKFWNRVYFLANDDEAQRIFKQMSTAADSKIGESPDDFAIYFVGHADEVNGTVNVNNIEPERIMTGIEALKAAKKDALRLAELRQEQAKITGIE